MSNWFILTNISGRRNVAKVYLTNFIRDDRTYFNLRQGAKAIAVQIHDTPRLSRSFCLADPKYIFREIDRYG